MRQIYGRKWFDIMRNIGFVFVFWNWSGNAEAFLLLQFTSGKDIWLSSKCVRLYCQLTGARDEARDLALVLATACSLTLARSWAPAILFGACTLPSWKQQFPQLPQSASCMTWSCLGADQSEPACAHGSFCPRPVGRQVPWSYAQICASSSGNQHCAYFQHPFQIPTQGCRGGQSSICASQRLGKVFQTFGILGRYSKIDV